MTRERAGQLHSQLVRATQVNGGRVIVPPHIWSELGQEGLLKSDRGNTVLDMPGLKKIAESSGEET